MSAWTAKLYDEHGRERIGTITVPHGPRCGEDFCDDCGDCLACYYCPHQLWIVYEDRLGKFLAEHEGAVVERSAP